MPDASTIVVEDRDGYADLRAWYADHPDFREHPALQFPVDISFEDGRTVTITSDEEMRRAREACHDDDDDDNDNDHHGGHHS